MILIKISKVRYRESSFKLDLTTRLIRITNDYVEMVSQNVRALVLAQAEAIAMRIDSMVLTFVVIVID